MMNGTMPVATTFQSVKHRTQQRILRTTRPPGKHDAVYGDGRNGECKQHADVWIGELHARFDTEPGDDAVVAIAIVAPKRNDCERQERRDEGKKRGKREHELVRTTRKKVFLEEQLDSVGQCLQQPERTGFVGPDAILHSGDDLALEPHHEHGGHESHHEHDQHLQHHDE
jgi:hypothetical protein